MKFVIILLGVALVLEHCGPWLLEKFFPQALLAPAPDVPVRPQRTASRQEALVNNEMDSLSDVQNLGNARMSHARQDSSSLVAASPASDGARKSASPEADFDYDEFRPAAREDALSAQSAQANQAPLGGVPDMFQDEATSAHA